MGGKTLAYAYDAQGRRARKQINAGVTTTIYTYRWDGARLVALMSGEGANPPVASTFTYQPNGRPLSITIPGVDTFAYHYDQFGNVERLTSSTGNLAARYRYDGRGKVIDGIEGPAWNGSLSLSNPYRSLGAVQAMSDEDGLTHLPGRTWDSALGRLISAQPSTADPGARLPSAGNALRVDQLRIHVLYPDLEVRVRVRRYNRR